MTIANARRSVVAAATILLTAVWLSAATAGPAAAEPNPKDFYPPIVQRLSEKQVETMKSHMDTTDNLCRFLPLPYPASVACGNPKDLSDAVNKAYYRDRGLVGKYYIHKGITSLNYYKWEVDVAPAGRAGSGLPAGVRPG